MAMIKGSEVKVGDMLELWGGRRARVIAIRPYDNDFARSVWPEGGARIADFDVGGGMTLDPTMTFDLVA